MMYIESDSGYTALHLALVHVNNDNHLSKVDLFRVFLEHGADINAMPLRLGWSFLQFCTHSTKYVRTASNLEVLTLFLKLKSLNVNQKDASGNTLLHFATFFGAAEAVKAISEHTKPDIALTNNNGKSPLHLAFATEHLIWKIG